MALFEVKLVRIVRQVRTITVNVSTERAASQRARDLLTGKVEPGDNEGIGERWWDTEDKNGRIEEIEKVRDT